MGHISNPMMTVRSLKGAPVSILVALIVARVQLGRSSLSAKELQDWTGYANEKITAGARLLMGSAMIVKARLGWALAEGVQFVLPGLDGRALSESDLIGLLPTAATGDDPVPSMVAEAVSTENPIKSDSFKLLRSWHIGVKVAEELAALDWATPDYLRAHWEFCQDRDESSGMFITRVRDGDPAPKAGRGPVTVDDKVGEFLRSRK